MSNFRLAAACFLIFFASSPFQVVHAVDDVILCTSCAAPWQFEAAAAQRAPGLAGYYYYAVGNPDSHELRYVLVHVSLYGSDPQAVPDSSESLSASSSSSDVSTSSYRASTGEEAEFGALVELSRNTNIIVAPTNSADFGSYQHRNITMVELQILSALDDAQPNWRLAQIGPSIGSILRKKLEELFGRGPGACFIFNNGDSACYKAFPISYAVTEVSGSAIDATGAPLSGSGGGGGGGGGEGLVPDYAPPLLGWRGPDDEVWLMCYYVEGVLQYCWVQP